jgi:hypothetical protein
VADAAQQLSEELKCHFPAQGVLDAMGVVFPQYWKDEKAAQISFRKHLNVLKEHLGQPRWIGESENKRLVAPVLDCFQLELQQPLFQLSMVSNAMAAMEPPFQVNPLTKMWRTLDANTALVAHFPEYLKLAQIAMVHVLGSVEDERAFSSLTFLKDKLRNRLSADHLGIVMGMHQQNVYTLENFPYDTCFQTWVQSAEHYRYIGIEYQRSFPFVGIFVIYIVFLSQLFL